MQPNLLVAKSIILRSYLPTSRTRVWASGISDWPKSRRYEPLQQPLFTRPSALHFLLSCMHVGALSLQKPYPAKDFVSLIKARRYSPYRREITRTMRLLDSRTLQFKEFIREDQTPRYAILSHTWGDDEVTFKDMHKTEQ